MFFPITFLPLSLGLRINLSWQVCGRGVKSAFKLYTGLLDCLMNMCERALLVGGSINLTAFRYREKFRLMLITVNVLTKLYVYMQQQVTKASPG